MSNRNTKKQFITFKPTQVEESKLIFALNRSNLSDQAGNIIL